MAKSVSAQKKDVRAHVDSLKHAAHRIGTSEAMYTLYAKKLAECKNASDLATWYYAFSKRVNGQIAQDHSEAQNMRGQLHSIERILGLQR